ncbi:hypothetical protein ARMGADRAFT_1140721 [Armillaria gallica]|uniref:C2H2-type domain-containing protein n=1 Tax=Armillaria gallica TaxID=47427 RepID=A0A2H3CMR9_ARMGA|nr:hypothetical protein ARMGADRAFT_1140721 [Armillaria gallica]
MPRALKQQSIPCKNKELGCTHYFSSANGVSIHLVSCKFCTLSFGLTIQTHHSHISVPTILLQLEHEHFNDNVPSNAPSPTRDSPSPIDGHAEDHEVPEYVEYHPAVNGKPCDSEGTILLDGTPPLPFNYRSPNDFTPFEYRTSFELADLLYRHNQMPAQLNDLFQIWSACNTDSPPFGEIETESLPSWKTTEYEVFFCNPCEVIKNQLANPDFANEMDFSLKCAWWQANQISDKLGLSDITYCPVIASSNKTTISVATGQNEFYLLYASNGLIHNNVCYAHRNGVSLIGFLSVPKTFHQQIFHGSLWAIFESLHPGMETPEILCYGDGHYCWTIYGLGPYIADYPEQALLVCIVQGWCPQCTASHHDLDGPDGQRTHKHTTTWFHAMSSKEMWDDYGIIDGIMPYTSGFSRANLHELLSPDLLHQIIKGTFKDHLVTWVEEYIKTSNTPQEVARILADIDCRYTGDDSKALMKVYLPAIAGHVPPQMVCTLSAFMEFCYCVRRSVIDEDDLVKIDASVTNFHCEREVFHDIRSDGTCTDVFSLPHQHALSHFHHFIQEFRAPNGLCSSIIESKHIKAALAQMLLINEQLDKLAAAWSHADISASDSTNENDDGRPVESPDILAEVKLAQIPVLASKAPHNIIFLAQCLNLPCLPELLSTNLEVALEDVDLNQCPQYHGKITVYPSAVSTYYSPSDLLGIGGLHHERICAMTSWRKGSACYDCVFCEADEKGKGFCVLHVACFSPIGDVPCPDTGMWVVHPDIDAAGEWIMSVIHLDCIVHAVHLIGVSGEEFIPKGLKHSDSLDVFPSFFVNKYADYHAHEIAF